MKTYTGYRILNAHGHAVEVAVSGHEEGEEARPLDPRFDLRKHSPTGFEWGYTGSGPAQLALALCADALGDDGLAQQFYQEVKFKVVGRLPHDGWTLPQNQLLAIIRDIEQGRDDRGR